LLKWRCKCADYDDDELMMMTMMQWLVADSKNYHNCLSTTHVSTEASLEAAYVAEEKKN